MTLQEIIAVWDELHVKDTGELGFCDLADAVEKVVGITNNEGVKVRDLDPNKSILRPVEESFDTTCAQYRALRTWIDKRVMELEDQQPNP